MRSEAAETIVALRAEVEAAKADAALARQGYATAYAEFDKKCRTINRLGCEKSAMKKALEKIAENDADGLHMYTPQAMQAVAVAALSTTEAK
ncbi:hypothetical protein CDQ91_10160 [Sphingopyxis witflariensis]|uniref:Uncharacterized protein n=2 Tax=Sphingopyxis witflariensis TaxID=173675 RepID=A0A246JY08_9SPHN|nr:hypothetical protein CDQ91_10160 [Sphingopyxis witflariensis]